MLHWILVILAAICLLLATVGINVGGRVHMGWLGLLLLLIAGLT